MSSDRFSLIVDVHLLLRKGNNILFLKRENTGYGDGFFHFPAGHLDGGESVVTALIRESREEIGITIDPAVAKLVHVMHRVAKDERMSFFFEVTEWSGEVYNAEPDKHSEVAWFDVDSPPSPMISYAKAALQKIAAGQSFSLYGWEH